MAMGLSYCLMRDGEICANPCAALPEKPIHVYKELDTGREIQFYSLSPVIRHRRSSLPWRAYQKGPKLQDTLKASPVRTSGDSVQRHVCNPA